MSVQLEVDTDTHIVRPGCLYSHMHAGMYLNTHTHTHTRLRVCAQTQTETEQE